MTSPETIVCKPTPWFLLRALVMFLMFGVFSVLFFIDGSTGYRKKNESFYLHKAFQQANTDFARMNSSGSSASESTLTPEVWKSFAAQQSVTFPPDHSILPSNLKLPMPWPEILQDYEKMKPLQWNILWREYTKERGLNESPPEEPYEAQKIHEQWIVFGICLILSLIAAFFLFRTLGRKISVDGESITTQQGRRVSLTDLKTLDLRKWETKGLAFIDFDGPSGKGRIRIDGLTYGGFKKEDDEPAERLMRQIRSRFSGEIIEYTADSGTASTDDPAPSE
ncbi:MAG: hypothetical protein ABI600_03155 [Luteolibacter sp.]